MRIAGHAQRTIWLASDGWAVEVIDQTRLPHELTFVRLESVADAARAIADMVVRGAPLIGATAAYGLCLALRKDPGDAAALGAREQLLATRPTAVNLRWALDQILAVVRPLPPAERRGGRLPARVRDLRRRRGHQRGHRGARPAPHR